MKTRIVDLAAKTAAVAGLAVGLALGGGFGAADAQDDQTKNYFDSQVVPVGARTGVDVNDPYAPVDLSGAVIAAGEASNARTAAGQSSVTDGESDWAMPPMPTLPGRPY